MPPRPTTIHPGDRVEYAPLDKSEDFAGKVGTVRRINGNLAEVQFPEGVTLTVYTCRLVWLPRPAEIQERKDELREWDLAVKRGVEFRQPTESDIQKALDMGDELLALRNEARDLAAKRREPLDSMTEWHEDGL